MGGGGGGGDGGGGGGGLQRYQKQALVKGRPTAYNRSKSST